MCVCPSQRLSPIVNCFIASHSLLCTVRGSGTNTAQTTQRETELLRIDAIRSGGAQILILF